MLTNPMLISTTVAMVKIARRESPGKADVVISGVIEKVAELNGWNHDDTENALDALHQENGEMISGTGSNRRFRLDLVPSEITALANAGPAEETPPKPRRRRSRSAAGPKRDVPPPRDIAGELAALRSLVAAKDPEGKETEVVFRSYDGESLNNLMGAKLGISRSGGANAIERINKRFPGMIRMEVKRRAAKFFVNATLLAEVEKEVGTSPAPPPPASPAPPAPPEPSASPTQPAPTGRRKKKAASAKKKAKKRAPRRRAAPPPKPEEPVVPEMTAQELRLKIAEWIIGKHQDLTDNDELELASTLLNQYLVELDQDEIVRLTGRYLEQGDEAMALAIAKARPDIFSPNE